MLRIYGSANSRALRVLWMVGELGIAYEHKDWLPRAPETRTPEFFSLNPNYRVPVIDDDGFVLSESMAINFYLAKKHNSPLYPADPRHEALALQWSLWETDRLDRQIVNYVRHTKALPEAERKATFALVDAAFQQRRKMLRQSLSGVLGGSAAAAAAALERAGIDPQSRGEQLRVGDFLAIARASETARA